HVFDFSNPAAIPAGTTVTEITTTTVKMSANAAGPGVAVGDQIVFQNTFTPSAPTPTGSPTLTFAFVPSSVALGQQLFDLTNPGAIPTATTVTGITGATVTMSAGATTSIPVTDQIAFAVGDGSGPGQFFVPDGPTGGSQTNPPQGCFYPQSTPAPANSV